MSEMELKTDMEVEEFTDDLSDEALDRHEEAFFCAGGAPDPYGIALLSTVTGGA